MYLYIICIYTSVVLGRASQPLQLQHFASPHPNPSSLKLMPSSCIIFPVALLNIWLPINTTGRAKQLNHCSLCLSSSSSGCWESLKESEISSKSPAFPKIRNFISDAAEDKSAPPLMDVSLLPAQSSNLCYPRGFSPSQTSKYQDYSAALVINPPKALQLEEKAAWGPCEVLTASVTDLLSRDEADQNFLTWVTAQIHQPGTSLSSTTSPVPVGHGGGGSKIRHNAG